MSPLVQCIYFQLPIPTNDENPCWTGRGYSYNRWLFVFSFYPLFLSLSLLASVSFLIPLLQLDPRVIEWSFPPPQIDAIRRHPLLLSTRVSINFKGKLVNRSPLFSLTRPGYMHTRHSGIPILNKEALFDVEYERTNERTNRIETTPHSRLTPLSWILYFMQPWFDATNLSNILPCWIFLFHLFLFGYFTRLMLIDPIYIFLKKNVRISINVRKISHQPRGEKGVSNRFDDLNIKFVNDFLSVESSQVASSTFPRSWNSIRY